MSLFRRCFEGALTVDDLIADDLIADHFARELHRRLYGPLWSWAGVFRRHETDIGVAPESSLDSIRYRWHHTGDWTPKQLGLYVHAEAVRIHPFTDGNGRTTRLLADLVLLAASSELEMFDWDLDNREYIRLLREYDHTRDVSTLGEFVRTRSIAD